MLVLGRRMTKHEVGTNGCEVTDDRNVVVVVELVVANETMDAVVMAGDALANVDAVDKSLDGDMLLPSPSFAFDVANN